MNCICDYLPYFCLHRPLVLSEDGVFVHLNVLKLVFVLSVWELVTQDLATAYLEA